MRNKIHILMLGILLSGCFTRPQMDGYKLAMDFYNESIKRDFPELYEFEYSIRGNSWSKSNDNSIFYCRLKFDTRSRIITIIRFKNFNRYFQLPIEKSILNHDWHVHELIYGPKYILRLTEYHDTSSIVKEIRLNPKELEHDPFIIYKKLDDLQKEFKFTAIISRPDFGNFREFYFSHEDVLTYLPDKSILKETNNPWKSYIENGKRLNKNWVYYKTGNKLGGG